MSRDTLPVPGQGRIIRVAVDTPNTHYPHVHQAEGDVDYLLVQTQEGALYVTSYRRGRLKIYAPGQWTIVTCVSGDVVI